jgi:hypothetical protein
MSLRRQFNDKVIDALTQSTVSHANVAKAAGVSVARLSAILHRDTSRAERETRTAVLSETTQCDDVDFIPADEYGFDELYCDQRNCDCRRVIINVLARYARRHVATINHAFEPPAKDALVPEQTFLDPLNRQSQWAPALLDPVHQCRAGRRELPAASDPPLPHVQKRRGRPLPSGSPPSPPVGTQRSAFPNNPAPSPPRQTQTVAVRAPRPPVFEL